MKGHASHPHILDKNAVIWPRKCEEGSYKQQEQESIHLMKS